MHGASTKIRRVTVMLVVALASRVEALDAWTTTDTAYQAAYTALHLLDWGQTRYIAQHGFEPCPVGHICVGAPRERFVETNPLLGRHPSLARVNAYFAASLLTHTAVARLLPRPYRRIWQAAWIGVEAGYVTRNHLVGIRLRF